LSREFIEGVVQFNGIEVLDVMSQHSGTGEIGRVKIPDPMLVMPA
jgi:hypothetical protein